MRLKSSAVLGMVGSSRYSLLSMQMFCGALDAEGSTGEFRNRLFQERKVGGEFARSLRTFVPIATEDLRIGFRVEGDFQIYVSSVPFQLKSPPHKRYDRRP